jgi:tripartite-type tricarboxylate transporter receptor subunit TctC
MNRRFWLAALAALGAMATGVAHAQAFPNKPIKVVVPSPPGGPPDLILRAVLPKMSAVLGQPIVVENRGGAGGLIGTAYVAGQPADGYTWLFTTASHVNIPPFNDNAKYDPVKDFTHVTLAAQNFGQALVVNPDLPARNVQELIALATQEPGQAHLRQRRRRHRQPHPGRGDEVHGRRGHPVHPLQGRGRGHHRRHRRPHRHVLRRHQRRPAARAERPLRVLALTGAKRWKGLPDVPTMDEQGLKGFNKVNWFGLWLPAGAPPDIVNRIHAAVAAAVNDPEVKQQFDTLGLEGVAMPPAQFARFVADEARAAQDIAKSIKK